MVHVKECHWAKKDKAGQPTGEQGTFWAIIFSDGREALTYDTAVRDLAAKALREKFPVEVMTEAAKKPGQFKILTLAWAGQETES